jgi:hypothetical protein
MTSYFERLVDFVGAHPLLSFLAVFLLALSEAVPVIGTVVPGSTLILAISALATTAGIMPWALLVAAVLGAIAGDGFSFWLGHRYQPAARFLSTRAIRRTNRAGNCGPCSGNRACCFRDTDRLGGIDSNMCTWSRLTFPSGAAPRGPTQLAA